MLYDGAFKVVPAKGYRVAELKFDEIGYWSEVKLDIVRKYAQAYSVILSKQRLTHVYIDAFAGAGMHFSKTTKEFVPGSPLNALNVVPPFKEYFFIDIKKARVEALKKISSERPETVHVFEGDCNEILLKEVFPNVKWTDFKRGLCLLDPYGLHLNWEVMKTAGNMESLEIFLNFPVMDMNMNVLWENPEKVDSKQLERMNNFWGDESWRETAYETNIDLFGDQFHEKKDNWTIAQAFKKRLKEAAGFRHVPDPIPMRNSIGRTVYYLFFASQKPVASDIINDIFETYRKKGMN